MYDSQNDPQVGFKSYSHSKIFLCKFSVNHKNIMSSKSSPFPKLPLKHLCHVHFDQPVTYKN